MSKRFTETSKWEDKWFRNLSWKGKLVFIYMTENCNNAGFLELDPEYISYRTKVPNEDVEKAIEEISKCYEKHDDIIWLKTFLFHQKNLPLNNLNNAHKQIISFIKSRPQFKDANALLHELRDDILKVFFSIRELVWLRDRGKCLHCNSIIGDIKDYHVDHVYPQSLGGEDKISNLCCSCKDCKMAKRDGITGLFVLDYDQSQAKSDLVKSTNLLNSFNLFFGRNLIQLDANIYESAPKLAPENLFNRGLGKGKGIGIGIGIGNENENENENENPKIEVYSFDDFWSDYDKKIDKPKVESKWKKISDNDKSAIKAHIEKYKRDQPEKQYRKNPEAYLNARAWENEILGKIGETAEKITFKSNAIFE